MRFADTHQRGYMVCDVTPTELVTRYQVVESTLVPDSPVTTAGTWTTLAGIPGRAADLSRHRQRDGLRRVPTWSGRAVHGTGTGSERLGGGSIPAPLGHQPVEGVTGRDVHGTRPVTRSMSRRSRREGASCASPSWRSTAPSTRAASSTGPGPRGGRRALRTRRPRSR